MEGGGPRTPTSTPAGSATSCSASFPCSAPKLLPSLRPPARRRKGSHPRLDGLVSELEGSPQKTCVPAPSSQTAQQAAAGAEGRPRGPDPAARVGLAQRPPRLPQSPRAPTGPRPATPSPGPPRRAPARPSPAPTMESHAWAATPGEPGDGAAVLAGRQKGPRPPPPPPGTAAPGFLPGSASRLQPEGTPPATARPARSPPYPDTAPLEPARPGTRPASAPAAGPPRPPPPPSAGFQIEIPWLGPSENSRRKPRPLLAEAPPRIPRPARPGRGNPRGQATPPRAGHAPGAGWRGRGASPRGSRGSQARCPAAGAACALRATLEIMMASACVRGVLS
ncbi:basic proline-rich protein-like [Phodopus roborovskii]|uniref:basic proline-rich protein-like n=1 Tax=Phodopus roborovskii TaxID=109678 RepID=UPI0021E3C034|nr:basic proline-rich protein-like [Phodopus roborovskii]